MDSDSDLDTLVSQFTRQEIDELTRSGRLKRLETASAHVFQLLGGRAWQELTPGKTLVHIFRDLGDDVDKIIARDDLQMIFNFIPLSASFMFACLSRKFVRIITNKFDKSAPIYGFGFFSFPETEKFCRQLYCTQHHARATLVPALRSESLGLSGLKTRSLPSTPSRASNPPDNTTGSQSGCTSFSGPTSTYNSMSMTSCSYPSSPYRQSSVVTSDSYLQLSTCSNYRDFLRSLPSVERFDVSQSSPICQEVSSANQVRSIPMSDAPDLSKNFYYNVPSPEVYLRTSESSREASPESSYMRMASSRSSAPVRSAERSQIGQCEDDGDDEDKVVGAEHRIRALMDAFQPLSVTNEIWKHPVARVTAKRMAISLPRDGGEQSTKENPAGVIGSPVKGRGGLSPGYQSPKK